jgi:hypothetical protein
MEAAEPYHSPSEPGRTLLRQRIMLEKIMQAL